jgi:hypothetical protein
VRPYSEFCERRLTVLALLVSGIFLFVGLYALWAAFACFAAAILLNALGLTGDPFVWARSYLPFLLPK